MILTGLKIKEEIERGRIGIDPFDASKLNPNSYNVTLANELFVYADPLDAKKPSKLLRLPFKEDGFRLFPGRLYLGRTAERTWTDAYAPMIEGRSSVGRLGIFIHATAGFGDVGFNGFWTLEISCVEPVVIYPGLEIGQIFFHEVSGKKTYYGDDPDAKYQNNDGVQGSRLWRDFKSGVKEAL